ncbi:MAG: DUF2920 family protein [Proteobacteria bacterium]|nr:DUF2920 family protein [Pseudomonadota bacterium]
MTLFQHTIDAHGDFELVSDIKRTVDYAVAIPDQGEIAGLVVYIAGFGEDAGSYRKNFQNHICKDYQMACLSVDYHCIFSRPDNGAAITIETETLTLLRSFTGLTHHENIDDIMFKAAEMKADPTTPLVIPGTLVPGNKEYQNFGILPALDHIFAINDLFLKHPHIPKTIYAIGSSYGGYIANLISKLAPCTLNAIFDNSSWATPNLKYINGQEQNLTEFEGYLSSNVILSLNVLSPWTHQPFMPNYFNENRKQIRSFPENHLEVMGKTSNRKTIYRCVHAKVDVISDTEAKRLFVNDLKKNGFDVQMEIYSKENIDGRYIKHMEHGMGLSMRLFFANALKQTQTKIKNDQRLDFDFEHTLYFPCDTQTYVIRYKNHSQPKCILIDK